MKCREVTYWLYSFRPRACWPADVVAHLQSCPDCRQVQADLKRIDEEIQQLTSAPGSASAKAHLLERVAKTPQAPGPAKPRAPFPWRRFTAYVVSAAALLLFGWLLGRRDAPEPTEDPKTIEVVREKLVDVLRDRFVMVPSSAERDLVAKLVQRNARLVQSATVKDRLDTLLDMADDFRTHVTTLLERGPRDQLPHAIELYRQLLNEAVPMQLQQAMPDERVELEAATRTRLTKLTDLGSAPLPAIVEEQRGAFQAATQKAVALLDRPPVVRPWERGESMSPMVALVQFAIAHSSEADALAKAERCAACVQRLTPVMMLVLSEEGTPRVELGQQFGEMIRFGVYQPIELATAKEPPQPVRDQAERILRDTAQSVAEMEKHLKDAPADVRPGLERALEATRKGWEKGKGKAKGKGKGLNEKGARLDHPNRGPRMFSVRAELSATPPIAPRPNRLL